MEINWCFMHFPLHYFQTRLQAQAAGVPYQGLCGTPCIETNTVCKQQLFFLYLSALRFIDFILNSFATQGLIFT